MQLGFY